jgi:hypothetical protein
LPVDANKPQFISIVVNVNRLFLAFPHGIVGFGVFGVGGWVCVFGGLSDSVRRRVWYVRDQRISICYSAALTNRVRMEWDSK